MSEIEQKFQEWLKENSAFITVGVRAPQGEVVSSQNFIPVGWTVVIGVNYERTNDVPTADSRNGDSGN